MGPVQKALWFVESHLSEAITLEEIATVCNISAFHLTRAFAATMGLSLMRYVRGRRLSEAARKMAEGADDILGVALDAGYGSHEAFTRAFREQFGLTPEQVRSQGHFNNISMVEAIMMSSTPIPTLAAPDSKLLGQNCSQDLSSDTTANRPQEFPRSGNDSRLISELLPDKLAQTHSAFASISIRMAISIICVASKSKKALIC